MGEEEVVETKEDRVNKSFSAHVGLISGYGSQNQPEQQGIGLPRGKEGRKGGFAHRSPCWSSSSSRIRTFLLNSPSVTICSTTAVQKSAGKL